MSEQTIIDVGMHVGRDTEFYLAKGFSVVAVEANPDLVAAARKKFVSEIGDGRLTVHDVAIAEQDGHVEFFVNAQKDDWGTISKAFASRNETLGTSNKAISVRSTRFENLLEQHGIPYYLKIDIEGADLLCLQALLKFDERPRFVSIEAGLNSFEETFTELSLLWTLGYRHFKIVNQALNHRVKCPSPSREGKYVDWTFDGACSGPFGDEAPGEWLSVGETLRRYRRLLWEQQYFGAGKSLNNKAARRFYELWKGEPAGWYDIHARHSEPGT